MSFSISYYNYPDEKMKPYVLMEELFHCMQFISQRKNYTSGVTINKEIEAKMAAYKYIEKNNPDLANDSLWWEFRDYLNMPEHTEEDYNNLVKSVRYRDGKVIYPENDFPDNEAFRDFDLMEDIYGKCEFSTSLKPTSMK